MIDAAAVLTGMTCIETTRIALLDFSRFLAQTDARRKI
jgi:hypothetical protein